MTEKLTSEQVAAMSAQAEKLSELVELGGGPVAPAEPVPSAEPVPPAEPVPGGVPLPELVEEEPVVPVPESVEPEVEPVSPVVESGSDLESEIVDPESVAKGSIEAKQLVRDKVEEMRSSVEETRSRIRVVEEESEELKRWEFLSENSDLVDQYLILDGLVKDLEEEVKNLEDKLDPRPSTGGVIIQRELDPQRKWLIAFKNERDGIESIIPQELLEKLQKIDVEEVKVEEPETLEVSEAEVPAPGPELVLEPEPEVPDGLEVPAVEVPEELDELQPEIPEVAEVEEPVEETPKTETIEKVKQRMRGEMERFKRIKSSEAFGSVLKNMTDYVHFLEGDSKNKFVEFATRFVKNNLDLTRESVDGIPEEFKGSKIEDIPKDARKDSWWTLIFFLLELGLVTSETIVNEAVTAINE